jgi:hypothetical protein
MYSVVQSQLNSVRWRDSTFEQMVATYNAVTLLVTEPSGRSVSIVAANHIDLVWQGHWDENVLKDVQVEDQGPVIERAKDRIRVAYGESPELGGGTSDLSGAWYCVHLRFLDGAFIRVIASSVTVEAQ